MKVTMGTDLKYDYFNGTLFRLDGKTVFFYESHNSLDKYQMLENKTDKVVVCAERKEDLLAYLVSREATIIGL